MKNCSFIFFTVFFSFSMNAQIINFPDANFKAKLLQANIMNEIAIDDEANSFKIDSNNNGEIEVSEVSNIYWLNVNDSNITSLSGIENFINLEQLNCNNNQLTNLNLTFRIFMEAVDCSNNLLTEVHFPPIVDEGIIISNNLIETLEIKSINGTGVFFILDCSNNPNLESILIKEANIETIYDTNFFSSEYFSNCPSLNYICAKDSHIANLQNALSSNGNTGYTINSDCLLSNQDFNFVDYFSISPNPAKDILTIQTKENIEVSSINIYNTLGQLVLLIPNAKDISTIDVSSLKTGNYFIKVLSDKGVSSTKFIKE